MRCIDGSPRFRRTVHRGLVALSRVEFTGTPDPGGPMILAALHAGPFRHGAVLAAAGHPREVVQVGAARMLSMPGIGPIFRSYGGIYVSAADALHDGLRARVEAVLRSGRVVGLMVDGAEMTRVRSGVRPGAAWLSARLGAPIVPARVTFGRLAGARVEYRPALRIPRTTRAAIDAVTETLRRALMGEEPSCVTC